MWHIGTCNILVSGCSPSDRKTLLCPLDGNIIIIYIPIGTYLMCSIICSRRTQPRQLAHRSLIITFYLLFYVAGNILYFIFLLVFSHAVRQTRGDETYTISSKIPRVLKTYIII